MSLQPANNMDNSHDKSIILSPVRSVVNKQALPNGYILEGRYAIEAELGSGGFGITYLAKHRYLEDIWVAIKEYLPAGAATRDSESRVRLISRQFEKTYAWGLHRFLDEARLLRQFQHPNIVRVQDFFEANNTAYMVMDYVKGRSVQAELDAGRKFDESQLRQIVYPLLDALRTIHVEGLFHRDISPDNILLREQDHAPILIDFGSARYLLRMHESEDSEGEAAHAPTAIFKPGYSPIEQYEGSEQGPYTDIYALGATLYRAALDARPVDALKRSGELRLKQIDTLEPAVEKGKGQYSAEFLRAIDAALRLQAGDRPATIDAWEALFGPRPTAEGAAIQIPTGGAARPRQSSVIWTLASVILVVVAAAIAYKLLQPTEKDIPTLMAQATEKLANEPFRRPALAASGELFFKVLTLEQGNPDALSGYNAANLLKQYMAAMAQQDLNNAKASLAKAESAVERAGIDTKILRPGWDALDVLAAKQAVRQALQARPLSTGTWSTIARRLRELKKITSGETLAKAGDLGLTALQSARSAADENDFAAANEYLSRAEEHFREFDVTELTVARREVRAAEQQWLTASRAEIETLFSAATNQLVPQDLGPGALAATRQIYEKILQLEVNHPQALAGLAVTESLESALLAIADEQFDSAAEYLQTAQRNAEAAAISSEVVTVVVQQAATAKAAWSIRNTRRTATELFAGAARTLAKRPFAKPATESAANDYARIQDLCQDIPELAREYQTATQGLQLIDAFAAMRKALDNQEFEAVRARLRDKKLLASFSDLGLGPRFAPEANQVITDREIDSLYQSAADTLDQDLLSAQALHQAQTQYERILSLRASEQRAESGRQVIAQLYQVVEARNDRAYDAVLQQLDGLREALPSLGVPDTTLEAMSEVLRAEQSLWVQQERERQLKADMVEAFGTLNADPFSEDAWQVAARLFAKAAQREGGADRAASGQRALDALRAAKQHLDEGEFALAQASIADAETASQAFGVETFVRARSTVERAAQRHLAEITAAAKRAIASARRALVSQPLSAESLQAANQEYRRALAGVPDMPEAQAGLRLTDALASFVGALAANDLEQANQTIQRIAELARTDETAKQSLATARGQLTSAEAARQLVQATQGVQQRIDAASLRLNEATFVKDEIPEETLTEVEDLSRQAIKLSQERAPLEAQRNRAESTIETVILLRALQAQVKQNEFADARATLDELLTTIAAAGLSDSLVARVTQYADDAEFAWHLGQGASSITRDLLTNDNGLLAAEAHYSAARRLVGARPAIASGLEGVAALKATVGARSARDYATALEQLATAQARFVDLGVDDEEFTALRETLSTEQARWSRLLEERDINVWTSQAIVKLDAAPLDEHAWEEAGVLAKRIESARNDDPRGQAVLRAITELRLAKTALDREDAPQAHLHVKQARTALATIGVRRTLDHASETIAQRTNAKLDAEFQGASRRLREVPLSIRSTEQAAQHFRRALALGGDHPMAQIGLLSVQKLQTAIRAISEKRYAAAASALADVRRALPTDADPAVSVLALRTALDNTRAQLFELRPSPGEIYPIIGAALQVLGRDPLGPDAQDKAESLLRDVLQLQTDEPSALEGIEAVNQLRGTNDALRQDDPEGARAALQGAQESLVGIGLSANILKPAWDLIEQRANSPVSVK